MRRMWLGLEIVVAGLPPLVQSLRKLVKFGPSIIILKSIDF